MAGQKPRSQQAKCKAQNCIRRATRAGCCSRHYQQIRIHGRLTGRDSNVKNPDFDPDCTVSGCTNPQLALGYCIKHHRRWLRYGRLSKKLKPPSRKAANSNT